MSNTELQKWTIGKSALLTDLGMCINHYRIRTVGLFCCIQVGVKIGDELLFPDLMVAIGHGKRKQCEPDFEQNYFKGPPNFVMDIHNDLKSEWVKERKRLFASSGVQEYLLVNEDLSKIQWNRLENKKYKSLKPDKEGLIKSTSLPGLWVSIPHLKKRDFLGIIGCIEHGLTRRDHHDLMDSIWNKN